MHVRATRDFGPSPGINQPRKICRKVLTSRGSPCVRERVKPAPLSRVPESPRGPRGDFLVLCLILPDADDPTARLQSCRLYDASGRCGTAKEEGRGHRGAGGTVGPYRRSRMTRQANCVISVQRTPPRLRRRPSSCRPFGVHIARVFVFQTVHLLQSRMTCTRDSTRTGISSTFLKAPKVNFAIFCEKNYYTRKRIWLH